MHNKTFPYKWFTSQDYSTQNFIPKQVDLARKFDSCVQ